MFEILAKFLSFPEKKMKNKFKLSMVLWYNRGTCFCNENTSYYVHINWTI